MGWFGYAKQIFYNSPRKLTLLQITNEFKFHIAAFHHAHETYLVPDLLKKMYGMWRPFVDDIHLKLSYVQAALPPSPSSRRTRGTSARRTAVPSLRPAFWLRMGSTLS